VYFKSTYKQNSTGRLDTNTDFYVDSTSSRGLSSRCKVWNSDFIAKEYMFQEK
jgi:hypothetical protein